ncbi:MAG: NAD(P)/FAD-dependent oxidoreductase [Chitinophagales bacterium]
MKKSINIVGGGLVGAVLTCYLAKRGYNINVYERRSDMRKAGYIGGRSINLALSNRGWAALEKIGLRELVESIAVPMKGRMVHHLDGSTDFIPYGKDGQAIYSVSRGDLNIAMINSAEKMPNVAFHFDQQFEHIDFNTNEITFRNPLNGSITKASSDFMFGADGAFSAVRYEMQKLPMFTFSQTYEQYGYKELHIPQAEGGGFRIEKNALHIWPRKSFMMIALPNPDGSFTCTLFTAFKGENSFEHLTDKTAVAAYFQQHFPSAVPHMPNLLEDFFANPTSYLATMRSYPWVHGNAALIGDAAHGVVPFYGQGMNCGFEDVRLLDQFLDSEKDWDAALDQWQQERKPNADAIADLALYNFIEMRDLSAQPAFQLRLKIEKRIAAAFPEKFNTLYSMVTFDQTPYALARKKADKQAELLDQIMRLDTIETRWESSEVLEIAKKWLDENV